MAHAAFRTWDRLENAPPYDNKNNRKVLRRFLKDFNTAAHARILSSHIECFGREPHRFYTIHNDTDAQRVLGLTFRQARNALLAGGAMRRNFTVGDLSGCAVCLTLRSSHKNIFTYLICCPPVDTIVIAGAYTAQK